MGSTGERNAVLYRGIKPYEDFINFNVFGSLSRVRIPIPASNGCCLNYPIVFVEYGTYQGVLERSCDLEIV